MFYEKASKKERVLAFAIDMAFLHLINDILMIYNLTLSPFLLIFLYFTIMHFSVQRTFGKWVLGIKLVDKEGDDPGFFLCALRTLLYPVSIFTLRFIHDKLTGTLVVRDEDF